MCSDEVGHGAPWIWGKIARMSDPQAAASALLELMLVKHGDSRTPMRVRDNHDGQAVLFGSSVLDIRIRAVARDDLVPPPAHATPSSVEEAAEYGSIEHRSITNEHLRVDLWQWRAGPDPSDEQTLDIIATFVWEGDAYRLELFSNSADFRKGLGRELPSAMTWASLIEVVREFVGAPADDDSGGPIRDG